MTFKNKPSIWILRVLLAFGGLYFVLSVPPQESPHLEGAKAEPFVWNQDKLWDSLENQFVESHALGCDKVESSVDVSLGKIRNLLGMIEAENLLPVDPLFDELEKNFFGLGPDVAVCVDNFPAYVEVYNRMRSAVKRQSRRWDMNALETRQRMYRLLYGGRTAVEEVMLQAGKDKVPSLIESDTEPSATPSTEIFGMKLHSGDLLLSRGNASYSALIARGHDYPGNFSHVAIVYVDPSTGKASFVEAHLIGGVFVSSKEEYLEDGKLRILQLRPRSDLPAIKADPMLPHKAALFAYENARSRHILYDLAMDTVDHERQFCSEVASAAYGKLGIHLWTGVSLISGQGITSWLSAVGVKNFKTQEPSDLEYDPQMLVIAEWRDADRLFIDHVDNAVIEVMLEDADRGEELEYSRSLLPFVRVMKAYSMILNLFNREGPIPEIMSSRVALLFKSFDQKHSAIKEGLLDLISRYRSSNGYTPPYWELVKMARQAKRRLDMPSSPPPITENPKEVQRIEDI